jgi:hypothetical protein
LKLAAIAGIFLWQMFVTGYTVYTAGYQHCEENFIGRFHIVSTSCPDILLLLIYI